jgi:hypothetical protein
MLATVKSMSEKYIPDDFTDRVWGWITFVKTVAGIYILWVLTHYVASHLYVSWCVPATFVGFIASPFLIPAPHCQALRWAVYTGGNSIMAMWGAFGLWLLKKVNLSE